MQGCSLQHTGLQPPAHGFGCAACDEGAVPHAVLNARLVGPVGQFLDVAQVRVAHAEAGVEDCHPDACTRVPQTPECLPARACMVVCVHGCAWAEHACMHCLWYECKVEGVRTSAWSLAVI